MPITGNDPTPRQFVESLLPTHYLVSETSIGDIVCQSDHGIHDPDKWDHFMKEIRKYFGDCLKQVYHFNIYDHKYFTVYYDYYKLHNLTPGHKLLPKEERVK